MQVTEFKRFLHDNEWVDRAVVSEVDAEARICRVRIELSLSGHQLIRDHGMQEFERRMLSHLPNYDHDEIYWDIRPVKGDVSLQDIPQSGPDFPRVLSVFDEPPQRRLLLDISPQLDWFRGHFPGNPILPGVVQLHWAVIVSFAFFGFRFVPAEIKRLKFKSVVIPPNVLELAVYRVGENEVQFEYASLGQQHAEGRLIFDEDKSC